MALRNLLSRNKAKKLEPKELHWKTNKKIEQLRGSRSTKRAMQLSAGLVMPAGIFFGDWIIQKHRGVFGRPGIGKTELMTAGLLAAINAIGSEAFMAGNIRKATYKVGAALFDDASTNKVVREFLESFRYVIIDGKGRVAGTNRKRILGIGRIRLDTKKILDGHYKEKIAKTKQDY